MYNKDSLRKKFASIVWPFLNYLRQTGVTPNHITVCGFIFSVTACYSYYMGDYIITFVLMTIGRGCDIVDGALARSTNQVTVFGGFLDSMVDRYSEFIIVATILFVYREQTYLYPFSFLVFLGISLMSYTRALYDKFAVECPGNPFEYFERNIYLVVFFLLGRLDLWLVIIALGANYFVLQRMVSFSARVR